MAVAHWNVVDKIGQSLDRRGRLFGSHRCRQAARFSIALGIAQFARFACAIRNFANQTLMRYNTPVFMASSAQLTEMEVQDSHHLESFRHSAVVRITHWITAISFFGLLVSGIMILIAHPRLYWGETGGWGTPALLNLPIPYKLGYSGWGRYLHFLSAWVSFAAGLAYVLSGIFTRHFGRNLLPAKADLAWQSIWRSILDHLHWRQFTKEESKSYNLLQRLAYLAVVFILFPLIFVTGFGMSPAITSVVPAVVNVFGGQQSARTLHFFIASILVLFFLAHIALVYLYGFTNRVRAMITGRSTHEGIRHPA